MLQGSYRDFLLFSSLLCLLARWTNADSLDMNRNQTLSDDALKFSLLFSTMPSEYLYTLYHCVLNIPLYLCLSESIWEGWVLVPQAVDFEMLSTPCCGAKCNCYPMPRLSASVQITSSVGSRHLVGCSIGSFQIWRSSKKLSPSALLRSLDSLIYIRKLAKTSAYGIIILQNMKQLSDNDKDEIWLRWRTTTAATVSLVHEV